MNPKSKKKPAFLSRLTSFFGGGTDRRAVGGHQDSARISNSNPGARPSRSDNHSPTPSGPDLLLPSGSSTPQYHKSQPPIRPLRTEHENNIVDSLQSGALLAPSNRDLLQPRQPSPTFEAHGGTTSFLQGASGLQMRDLLVNVNSASDKSIDGWKLLLENTATNALHDSDARYDPPKCDEDTRVGVTGEIMDWIQDREGPQRLLCMTGAAGAGKSALQQTTAEKCSEGGILGSAFFFSASDPTRNTVKQVIPTIAYQIGRTNDILRWCIKAAVENDPLIFSKSLRAQMSTLIVQPSQRCEGIGTDLTTLPYAILIDGLDECTDEDRQAELLAAVEQCLLIDNLPFRVFIASRPEWVIRTALEPGGHLHKVAYHIQLSDQYDASADMRRYLQRRFEAIGLRIRDPEWFSEGDIETLVRAASGQFIYVAMVYKYISGPRASPVERLKIVLTWTPREGQVAQPFEALDRLYYNILLGAKKAYEAIDTHHGRDFLLLLRVHQMNTSGIELFEGHGFWLAADLLSALLSLEARAEENLISDLRSLLTLETDDFGGLRLHLYHKSFSDFLEEPSRAKDLFVPEALVHTRLAKCFMQRIIECPLDFDSVPLPAKWEELPLPALDRRFLTQSILCLIGVLSRARVALIDDEVVSFTQNGGWEKIDKLMPLLCFPRSWLARNFKEWIGALSDFAEGLQARKPGVAVVISVFTEKWKNDYMPIWEATPSSCLPVFPSDSDNEGGSDSEESSGSEERRTAAGERS